MKVSLKILNSGIILKTITHAHIIFKPIWTVDAKAHRILLPFTQHKRLWTPLKCKILETMGEKSIAKSEVYFRLFYAKHKCLSIILIWDIASHKK